MYEVPESGRRGRRARGRTQDLATLQSKAQVAMGAVGGSDGRWPVPPAPPPTWMRGGNSWVYDHTYGVGQRPTTGVWGPGVLPKTPAPAAQDEVVEEILLPKMTVVVTTIVTKNINPKIPKMKVMKMNCVL